MSKIITLREYQSLGIEGSNEGDRRIHEQDWQDIRDYVQNNPDPEGQWVMEVRAKTLKAKNYVGVLQTRRGTTIEILPKVELGREASQEQERAIFLRMLRRWRNGPYRNLGNAEIKSCKNFPLLEAFITMFLKDILKLTRRGLACAYNEIEENRPYLKGKLLIAQHVRHNLIHKERFYVRYEEFSANRPINRLLKSTLLLLQRLSRSETNLAHIRQAHFYFEELPASTNIDADLTRARVDRTMPLYSRLFPWAQLFLKRAAPTTWHGRTLALALLFPMERIFEDYVAHLIRTAAAHWKISTQERRYHLINKNPQQQNKKAFRLCPDIVARLPNTSCLIMDTKWKPLNTKAPHYDISQADLYQLYAYGKKYQAAGEPKPTLYLLYPYNKDFQQPLTFKYEENLQLTAFPINLALEENLTPKTPQTKTLQYLFTENSLLKNQNKAA